MAAEQANPLDGLARALAKVSLLAILTVVLTGAVSLVAVSPLLMRSMYDDDGDWSRLGDIGQTYGVASALLSTITLAVVSWSLLTQRRQFRNALRTAHRERTRATVLMTFQYPALAQCWGPRFAPDHVDERLIFYANMVCLNWMWAWEDRLIDERTVRTNLRTFFASEVPRVFWERHGDWHRPGRRWPRRRQFLEIVNEEYLCAVKSAAPTRPLEPFTVQPDLGRQMNQS